MSGEPTSPCETYVPENCGWQGAGSYIVLQIYYTETGYDSDGDSWCSSFVEGEQNLPEFSECQGGPWYWSKWYFITKCLNGCAPVGPDGYSHTCNP